MDTLTHALSGALLGRASAPVAGVLPVRRRVVVALLAAAFPDTDVAIALFTDPLTYINLHRGVTHSLVLLPLWALLLGGLFSLLWRDRRHWRSYAGVAALGLGIHILGDVITSYGTQVFAPVSDYKAAIPTTFIIDLWFTGIIVAGLLASLVWRHSRVPSVAALVVLTGYVGMQGVLRLQALEVAAGYARKVAIAEAEITALPQPLSPFNWKLIVAERDRYHVASINLLREEAVPPVGEDAGMLAAIDAVYRPVADPGWEQFARFGDERQASLAREAWAQEAFAPFRRFAGYPVVSAIEESAAGTCVWFTDLRFTTGGPSGPRVPFRYGMCRGPEGWVRQPA